MLTGRILAGVTFLWFACATAGDPVPEGNRPPVFSSSPALTADHNRPWSYAVRATDPDGDSVTVAVSRAPAWVVVDTAAMTLSGLAGFEHLGAHAFHIVADDGQATSDQHFVVDVTPGEIDCAQDFGDPAASDYVLPFPPGRTYRLIQGNCNTTGGHVNWFAYDFDTAIGDSLVASRAGTVIAVREHFADGTRICGREQENLVFVRHADSTIMAYIHLTTLGALVAVGDTVAQGQVIALSGDSGCSSGPHVHVALFAARRTGFDRQWSLPVNYSNADGPLNAQRGLVAGGTYRAIQ